MPASRPSSSRSAASSPIAASPGALIRGETVAPMDKTFKLIGGNGPLASIGPFWSWVLAVRRLRAGSSWPFSTAGARRRRFNFPQRPIWAEIFLACRRQRRRDPRHHRRRQLLSLGAEGHRDLRHRATTSRSRPASRIRMATQSAWRATRSSAAHEGLSLLDRLCDPRADRARGRLRHDLHRHAHALRTLRLRNRRQSGSGRTVRHQHQAADGQGVHADGRAGRRSRRSSPRPASTRPPTRSASSTNST